MIIMVDPDTGKVQKLGEETEDKALKICDRLDEELEDWLHYHEMAQKTHDTRYEAISEQEFQHMLVALSDFLDNIKGRLTPAEMAQYNKFREECLAE